MIDLREGGEIIETRGERYDYVALSYHRAKENGVNLTDEEKSKLRHFKPLSQHLLLPPIVHETMKFVRNVGERYVWIDFLCLAHGEDVILEEMKRMDKIYAGALFTIIAACETGLYGPKLEHSRAESISSKAPQHADARTMKLPEDVMAEHYRTLLGSTWATRGWTFQERMFSTRAIIFVPRTTTSGAPDYHFFWECECAMWDDRHLTTSSAPTIEKADARSPSDPRFYKPDAKFDDRLQFARYLQTMYYYNNREFRNDQDVLRAIYGCLRTLMKECDSLQSGFICGLPRRNFHEGLLWQPLGNSTRRKCRCEGHGDSPHQVLPSWSWCGWQCDLDVLSIPVDQRQDLSDFEKMDHFPWQITPTVNWEIVKNGNPTAMGLFRPVAPKGEELCELTLLTCEADTAELFIRQVHTPRQRDSSGPRRALQYKTPLAKLQSTNTRQVASLQTSDGTWAGVLGLMSNITDPNTLNGLKVKLMAISKGSVNYQTLREAHEESTDDQNSEDFPEPERNNPLKSKYNFSGNYQFYNVLWVVEKDGHLSRKALGRVEARAWDNLCLATEKTRIFLS